MPHPEVTSQQPTTLAPVTAVATVPGPAENCRVKVSATGILGLPLVPAARGSINLKKKKTSLVPDFPEKSEFLCW